MQLDIISDTVCPWCYIGKKRLEKAQMERPTIDFKINWRPFQLDPTIPAEGVDRQAYIEAKFGAERAKSAGNAIREAGEMEGISFAFDKIMRSPNTLDSHRLIKWAGSAGVQDKVVDQLFARYFENGENIGEHSVLLEAASDSGMDVDIVRELLASDSDLKQTQLEDKQAREMGISGVPCFLFEGKFAIVGAQEVSSLTRYIDKVEAKLLQQAAS